jgi:(2Fe-2S) ferredoxin
MGACTGAPAMQVNYDFYENLDAEKVDAILEQLRSGETAARSRDRARCTSACPRKCR